MWISLSNLGIPWALNLALDLGLEVGRFSLRPALSVQRVMKYTSPGFLALWKLSKGIINWEEAEGQFRELYRSDPTFPAHTDPGGLGYLQVELDVPINYPASNELTWV